MKVLISMSASSESPALSMALKKHLIKLKEVLPVKLGKVSVVLKQELPRKHTLKIKTGKATLFLTLVFTASASTIKDAKITGIVTFGKEEVRLATFAKRQGITVDLNASTLVKLVKELTKVYGGQAVETRPKPGVTISQPTMLLKALEKASALGIESKVLATKLSKIPYILSVKRTKKQTGRYDDTKQAGFFPPTFLTPSSTITFVNGSKLKGAEVFEAMKKVGGGLTGTASKEHNMQKGCAPSRLTGEMLQGSTGDVTIDGFEVPGAWVDHYKRKHKIPLNLFTNNIEGVSVCYIANKPVV